jgi:predicted nucleic acid-binding protein
MYIFDTNAFHELAHFYPSRFPTIWAKIDELAENQILQSVKEVRREIERNCPFDYLEAWVKEHHHVFLTPNEEESRVVAEIFQKEQYRGLVKREKMLKGLPVADPFIIAAAKVHKCCVVTQESFKSGGARIPTVCDDLKVKCINLESFLAQEQLGY